MNLSIAKIYKTSEMKEIIKEIEKINSKSPIFFIYGDKGTEKEYIAQFIQSRITDSKIVYVNDLKDLDSSLSYIVLSDYDLTSIKEKAFVSTEIYEALSGSYKIYIPPLKYRKQDILPLAYFFLREIENFLKLPSKNLTKDAKEALVKYSWPENAYQLKRVLTKAYINSKGRQINSKDLFIEYEDKFSIRDFLELKIGSLLKGFENIENSNLYDTVIQEVEKALISLVLSETKGNQLKTAKILGINRNTLSKRIKQYNLI